MTTETKTQINRTPGQLAEEDQTFLNPHYEISTMKQQRGGIDAGYVGFPR